MFICLALKSANPLASTRRGVLLTLKAPATFFLVMYPCGKRLVLDLKPTDLGGKVRLRIQTSFGNATINELTNLGIAIET